MCPLASMAGIRSAPAETVSRRGRPCIRPSVWEIETDQRSRESENSTSLSVHADGCDSPARSAASSNSPTLTGAEPSSFTQYQSKDSATGVRLSVRPRKSNERPSGAHTGARADLQLAAICWGSPPASEIT